MAAPAGTSRKTIAAVLIVGAALGAGYLGWRATRAPEQASIPSVLVHEHAGFRYEYHVPTGRESLYDAARDPRGLTNLIEQHRDVAATCRRALEQENHVGTLDELRARYEAEIRRLRALGYL